MTVIPFAWSVGTAYRVTATSISQEGVASLRSYNPLHDFQWLHRHFAALSGEDYAEFASTFGLLGFGGRIERVSSWQEETKAARRAVSFVDVLWGRTWPAWEERLIPRRVLTTFDQGQRFASLSRAWVFAAMQELLTSKLKAYTSPTCLQQGTALTPALSPTNLIGAIWLLMAKAASGEKDEADCLFCGSWMTLGRATGGRRMGTKFCTPACRVAAYQRRSRFADLLLADGVRPETVAFKSGLGRQAMRRRLRRMS